jgi:hypothetical protein
MYYHNYKILLIVVRSTASSPALEQDQELQQNYSNDRFPLSPIFPTSSPNDTKLRVLTVKIEKVIFSWRMGK